MVTKQAISRLAYTIGKGNKPNETDKVALNSIITYINKFESETIQENLLFAKLYALVLSNFVTNYLDIDFANKQINKELSFPLEYHSQNLQSKLNMVEIENFYKSKGIRDTFLVGKPIAEAVKNYEKNKELFPEISTRELLEIAQTWDYDNVISYLNRNINESLNTYKNV